MLLDYKIAPVADLGGIEIACVSGYIRVALWAALQRYNAEEVINEKGWF